MDWAVGRDKRDKWNQVDHSIPQSSWGSNTNAQMYADMFLYIPWQDEEVFFGEAGRSEEAGQKLWDKWGDAAKDLKNSCLGASKSHGYPDMAYVY